MPGACGYAPSLRNLFLAFSQKITTSAIQQTFRFLNSMSLVLSSQFLYFGALSVKPPQICADAGSAFSMSFSLERYVEISLIYDIGRTKTKNKRKPTVPNFPLKNSLNAIAKDNRLRSGRLQLTEDRATITRETYRTFFGIRTYNRTTKTLDHVNTVFDKTPRT